MQVIFNIPRPSAMFSRAFPFLLFCLAAGISLASDSSPSVFVRVLSYEQPIERVYVRQGRAYLPVEVKPYAPGQVLRLFPENGELVFYRLPSETSVSEEPSRLGSAKVLEGARSLILAFVPAPVMDEGDPWRVLVFDDDERSFPAGSVRVINLSPFPLALRLGDYTKLLAPSHVDVVFPKTDEKNRVFSQLATRTADGGWFIFQQGPLAVHPRRRETLLIAWSSSVLAARDMAATAPAMVVVPWHD